LGIRHSGARVKGANPESRHIIAKLLDSAFGRESDFAGMRRLTRPSLRP
jgi:hypothetical protein